MCGVVVVNDGCDGELEQVFSEPMDFTREELDRVLWARGYNECPVCGCLADTEPYLTKVYQEDCVDGYDDYLDCVIKNWLEVHKCYNCGSLFQFLDGM